MRIKVFYAISLLIAAVAAAVWLIMPTDESRIRKLFKEGAAAVESEDIDGVMSKVSLSYRDEYGFPYLYVKETIKRWFETMSDIDVEYENLRITVNKNTALAEVDVRVIATLGSDTGYFIGDVRKPLPLKFTLEKERSKWLIVKSEGFVFY